MTAVPLFLRPCKSHPPGRGLVRMPLDKMADLGVEAGDAVSIMAGRLSHARVLPGARGTGQVEAGEELLRNIAGVWGHQASLDHAVLPKLATVILKPSDTPTPHPARLSESLYDLPMTLGDKIALMPGQSFEVVALDPSPAGIFAETTTLTLQASPMAGYAEIGGLSDQIARVHEMVALPLLRPELFERLGVPAPRGVLFTGPPGSGKTLLARCIAAQTSAAFFRIGGPEIVSKHYGESEAALRQIFAAAAKDAPAIIFIDEIDAIAPRREGLSGEKQVERRIVAQLLTLMDGLSERGRIIVMAATNLPDSLDMALRRPGRFDREIHFGPPTPAQRRQILDVHLRRAPLAADVDLELIAREAHGYVGADLAALAREASLAALDRAVAEAGGEAFVKAGDLFLTQADLTRGLATTLPSALRDTQVESPVVTFADVGGQDVAKAALTEAVIWPQKHRAAYVAMHLRPVTGVLLSGPPGSGKTLLARALAHESGMNFIPVRPTRIISQFLGDAERSIAEVFTKARHTAPCLIFFDELDVLAPRRNGKDAAIDRIVAQMLTEMDGLSSNVGIVVLAATNRAAAIDPALTRPGRIDTIVPLGLPDLATRRAILGVHCRDVPLSKDVALDQIAAHSAGLSGAELAGLVSTSARIALRRALANAQSPLIEAADFTAALGVLSTARSALNDDFIQQRE